MRKYLIILLLVGTIVPGLWAQMVDKKIEKKLLLNVQSSVSVPVVAKAKRYLTSYYQRTDFSQSQWMRVRNFLTWMKEHEEQLNAQFSQTIGKQWNTFSTEKQQVIVGAWLGMKYAVDKIGGAPDAQFGIVLDTENWDQLGGDYSRRKTIYCTKGNFVEKVNIGLHEAVHLLPYLRNSYRIGQDFEDSFREQYTLVSQQRYALPVRLKSASIAGTRTFFPVFNNGRGTELLEEYAEGITSLIDYDALWENRSQWNVAANNSNESLDMRLREEVFIALEVSNNSKRSSFYSAKGNEFFRQVGQEIIQTYCNRLPPKAKDKQPQIDYLHACFDNNASGIIKIVAKHLKPLVSKNIPPVPAGYM